MKKLNCLIRAVTTLSWAGLLSTAIALPAGATVIVFEYGVEVSGAEEPEGATKPWLTATFDDGGTAGTVTLTMSTVGLVEVETVTEWDFNYTGDSANLVIAYSSGVTASGITNSIDCCSGDGQGNFDIEFLFDAGDFGAGASSVYDFALAGLTASDFISGSTKGDKGKDVLSVAHVQRIDGPAGEDADSGWVSAGIADDCLPGDRTCGGPPVGVPEPNVLLLLGAGLLGLARVNRTRGGSLSI